MSDPKFKEAGNGQFIRISNDENGNELSRTATFSATNKPGTMGHGFYQEMLKHEEDGGIVEQQYTAEEQTVKDAEEAEAAKTAYIGLRASEYPSIGDQLDYIYHNGVDAWKADMITPIKVKYPKPEVTE